MIKKISVLSLLFVSVSLDLRASICDTLLFEKIKVGDTLFVKSESTSCRGGLANEVIIFLSEPQIKIILFDSLEINILPKESLSNRQKRYAERIMMKYNSGKLLSKKKQAILKRPIEDSNSLFSFYHKYNKSDTLYISEEFNSFKTLLLSFEKELKIQPDREKSNCINSGELCRTKVTLNINHEFTKYVYFLTGCETISSYFSKLH